MKVFLVIVFLVLTGPPITGFAEEEGATQIRFAHHNPSTGLPTAEVSDLYLDEEGWMWVATSRGLNQFNVFTSVTHTHQAANERSLSSDRLTCLAPGFGGKFWVGTFDAGLNEFDPETRSVNRVYPGQYREGEIDARGLTSPSITALATSEDQYLWIGTDRGLFRMNLLTRMIKPVSGPASDARISCLAVFHNKEVWAGTAKGEVFRWNPKQSQFGFEARMEAPVTAIGEDADRRMWIGTDGLGLHQFYPGGQCRRIFAERIRDVSSLVSDENGSFWIGTSRGAARLSRDGGSLRFFQSIKGEEESLSHNTVVKILQDKPRRMLWIATLGGVSRFGLDKYWFPLFRDGDQGVRFPHPSIWSMAPSAQHSGNIWIGTENGLFLWDLRHQTAETALPGLADIGDRFVQALAEDKKGNLWVGTRGEGLICRSADGAVKRYRHDASDPGSLGHDYVSEVFADRDDHLWVGTHGEGIYLFDRANETFVKQSSSDGKLQFVTRIRQDETGGMWAGTTDSLYLLDRLQADWIPCAAISRGLKEVKGVTAIVPSGALVWFGTSRGEVIRYGLTDDKIAVFAKEDGLPGDGIVSMARDFEGQLWVATARGISLLDRENKIRHFTANDGLQRGFFRPNACAQGTLQDGRTEMCFGGSEGLNVIDPRKYPAVTEPPRPFLTAFEFFDQEVIPEEGGLLEKPLSSTDVISIPFDARNQFAFRFANLDFHLPNHGYFRYQMVGYDLDWIVADSKRRAGYLGLPVGNYEFRVQSSPNGENWSDERMAKVKVRITPPWWAIWWLRVPLFLTLLGAGLIGFWQLYQRRMRKLREYEKAISAERDRAEIALARQLQHAMLLERTSRDFNLIHGEDEIFTNPLKSLAEHFKAEHGMIFRIQAGPDDADGTEAVRRLANYSAVGKPLLPSPHLHEEDPLVQAAFQSESCFVVEPTPELARFVAENGSVKPEIQSLLFVGTRFLNRINGLIVLFSSRKVPDWDAYELKLFDALSPQFGISIAQLKVAEKEKKYLHHLEEARHQAEVANRAKSDFLAKMIHELRTPLNSIIGFTEIAQEDDSLSPRQRELIDIVNNSGDHLLDVINDILDLSKIEAGKIEKSESIFEFIPLLKSVHEMLGMKARSKGIGFDFGSRTSLPAQICTDRSKLRQILINLIGNAIKFTDQGSVTIAVSACALGSPAMENGLVKRRVRITFDVTDTGKGISKEDLPKLFQKYSQTESGLRSSEGTGLGLPIAKSFIQLLGGDVKVESEYGKGTRFLFFIECDEVASLENKNSEASLTESKARKIRGFRRRDGGQRVRILIAEDQANNRFLLSKILGKVGFELAEAKNGKEAVEIAAQWKPDLILMDEDMPVLKGSEATRQILRAHKVHPPVIISLTAYALEQARQKALEAGCSDFLAKPFKSQEIFTAISRHLQVEYVFEETPATSSRGPGV